MPALCHPFHQAIAQGSPSSPIMERAHQHHRASILGIAASEQLAPRRAGPMRAPQIARPRSSRRDSGLTRACLRLNLEVIRSPRCNYSYYGETHSPTDQQSQSALPHESDAEDERRQLACVCVGSRHSRGVGGETETHARGPLITHQQDSAGTIIRRSEALWHCLRGASRMREGKLAKAGDELTARQVITARRTGWRAAPRYTRG